MCWFFVDVLLFITGENVLIVIECDMEDQVKLKISGKFHSERENCCFT